MGYHLRTDALGRLLAMRKSGQRPIGPVVITDDALAAEFAQRAEQGFFVVPFSLRQTLGARASAFAGLDVSLRTREPFENAAALSAELVAAGVRELVLCDLRSKRKAQWIMAA